MRKNVISAFSLQDVCCCGLHSGLVSALPCAGCQCHLVPHLSQSRAGCSTSAQDGQTPAAAGMCSRDFTPATAGETPAFPCSSPSSSVPRLVFALAGSGAGCPWGHCGCHRAPGQPVLVLVGGTSVYLPFHHLMAVPCHVAGPSPWAASPV